MPITSRCNSRCKTCNIWKYNENNDIDYHELKNVLQDSFFSEVESVGLNGGEFTLMPDFIGVVDAVLCLPRISGIYLISNGLFPKRLFEYLKAAKVICDLKKVHLHICISVDGEGAVHEKVRGVPNCFEKTKAILNELYANKEDYCSSFSVGCTLSRYNIAYIRETEVFFHQFDNLKVEYHLAVPNKRIRTFDDYSNYYALNDEESRCLAAEFFFGQYFCSVDEQAKRQAFINFQFLKNKGEGRLCECAYLGRDVTIDENLNISLCATASDVIGNLRGKSATELMTSANVKKVYKCVEKSCPTCVHYSYHPLTFKGRLAYLHDILRNKYVFEFYEVRSQKNLKRRIKFTCLLAKRFGRDALKMSYRLLWKLQ